jgi:hypothetical protein
MHQPHSDPRYPEWHILSTYVRLADGLSIQLLLGNRAP